MFENVRASSCIISTILAGQLLAVIHATLDDDAGGLLTIIYLLFIVSYVLTTHPEPERTGARLIDAGHNDVCIVHDVSILCGRW